jgi:hypothetical protein
VVNRFGSQPEFKEEVLEKPPPMSPTFDLKKKQQVQIGSQGVIQPQKTRCQLKPLLYKRTGLYQRGGGRGKHLED